MRVLLKPQKEQGGCAACTRQGFRLANRFDDFRARVEDTVFDRTATSQPIREELQRFSDAVVLDEECFPEDERRFIALKVGEALSGCFYEEEGQKAADGDCIWEKMLDISDFIQGARTMRKSELIGAFIERLSGRHAP